MKLTSDSLNKKIEAQKKEIKDTTIEEIDRNNKNEKYLKYQTHRNG